MNEKEMLHKQLLKNMVLTFIAFSIIFSVFDFIVYHQVNNSVFNSIDQEITQTSEKIKQNSQILDRLEADRDNIPMFEEEIDRENVPTFEEDETIMKNILVFNEKEMDKSINENEEINENTTVSKNILRENEKRKLPEKKLEEKRFFPQEKDNFNPRLIYVIRDEATNIISSNNMVSLNGDATTNISFDKTILDSPYSLNVNGYYYRGENFITNYNGQTIYVQILANVDGEVETVGNTLKTLIITTSITIIMAIFVSYILSRITLKPIIESFNRQTEFVQNASHELRTPLTIIQAKQELLLQEPNKKIIDKSKDITICINETRRLSKMVKELMTLAKADSGKLEIFKEKVDINQLIKEVTEPYIELADIQKKKVYLNLNYEGLAMLDKNKISELLIIILDNALKYTLKGDTITISTFTKDNKLLLEVADTGIGISEEGLKKIFVRFYREDKARNRETGGNGLGLSIAQTIVSSHNGNIKLIKNEPKGTKVIIKI